MKNCQEAAGVRNELGQVVDALPGLVWTALPDGHIDFLNQRWCEYTGLGADAACGVGWQAAIHPEDLPELVERWRSILASGEPGEMEARLRRFDGEYRCFVFRLCPLVDASGHLVKWCGINTDIEDRKRIAKRAEALLAGEKRLLEMMATGKSLSATLTQLCLLVQSLCAGCVCCSILLLDQETGRLWHAASPSVPKVYTESIDGFVIGPEVSSCGTAAYHGKQVVASDIATDPRWAEFRDLALGNGLRACWSTPIFSQQNQVLGTFAMFSGKPGHPTADDQDVIGQVTHLGSIAIERARNDVALQRSEARKAAITEERRLSEEALGEVRSELARVARVSSLGALAASIAHEVNQPLSGIIINASTCLRMLATDPPNVDGARETARRTIRDGNRASEVITRLRALFGKKNNTAEWVDLNEAAREVIALTLRELQRSRVVLRTELGDGIPPVIADRVQLQQVILNLLLNASEAMSSVDDRPRQLTIRTERGEGDHVCLAVRDTGVGFEPVGVEKLFEAFYTTKSGGMGIGLSVSRSIIESHHGRLWAAPNDGPGATFSFSIPQRTE